MSYLNQAPPVAGFFVYRHLGLLLCNIIIVKKIYVKNKAPFLVRLYNLLLLFCNKVHLIDYKIDHKKYLDKLTKEHNIGPVIATNPNVNCTAAPAATNLSLVIKSLVWASICENIGKLQKEKSTKKIKNHDFDDAKPSGNNIVLTEKIAIIAKIDAPKDE